MKTLRLDQAYPGDSTKVMWWDSDRATSDHTQGSPGLRNRAAPSLSLTPFSESEHRWVAKCLSNRCGKDLSAQRSKQRGTLGTTEDHPLEIKVSKWTKYFQISGTRNPESSTYNSHGKRCACTAKVKVQITKPASSRLADLSLGPLQRAHPLQRHPVFFPMLFFVI